MVFVPNKQGIRIGDQVLINQELSTLSGTFTKGHKFTVKSIESMGGMTVYNLSDSDGHGLNDVPGMYLEEC